MKVVILLSSLFLLSSYAFADDGFNIPVSMKKITGSLSAASDKLSLGAKIKGKFYFIHATEENAHKACIRAGYDRATSIEKFSLEGQRDPSTYTIVLTVSIDGSEDKAGFVTDSNLKFEVLRDVDCEKDL
jgi:hypothetical protein